MSNARVLNDVMNKSIKVEAEFGGEQDARAVMEAVKVKIVDRLVNMYVDAFADEIIASIDLETIKKKTNEEVTKRAIKEWVKS